MESRKQFTFYQSYAEAVARIDCGCVDSMTAINIANFFSVFIGKP